MSLQQPQPLMPQQQQISALDRKGSNGPVSPSPGGSAPPRKFGRGSGPLTHSGSNNNISGGLSSPTIPGGPGGMNVNIGPSSSPPPLSPLHPPPSPLHVHVPQSPLAARGSPQSAAITAAAQAAAAAAAQQSALTQSLMPPTTPIAGMPVPVMPFIIDPAQQYAMMANAAHEPVTTSRKGKKKKQRKRYDAAPLAYEISQQYFDSCYRIHRESGVCGSLESELTWIHSIY
jgi:hypothetical protein